MPMPRLLLTGLLLLSACGTHSAIERSRHLAAIGDHQRAFRVLDEAIEAERKDGETPSPELEAAHRKAHLKQLLESARAYIFAEREDQALVELETLEGMSPDYPGADRLRERAIYKKAVRAVQIGDEYLLRKDLENALASYLRATALKPDFEPAIEGSERVRAALAHLSERAQSQFLEAVRKLPEFRFVEVRWHSEIALANEPDRKDAEKLQKRAQHEIALKAVERGLACMGKDQFGAALIEFKAARRIDEALPGIDEKIAQAEREVQALNLMERAQVAMRSGHFDLAREDLGRAFELSTQSRGGISELMIQTRQLEGEARYRAARDLEILGKKGEALAAFEALAKEWPEGFSDEAARVEGLSLDIDTATAEWAAAEAAEQAGDAAGALLHYETAMQFYPGWKDGAERIERLKKAIAGGADGSKQE
jgi:tetratricopeptide (TPR) repeat protein